MDGITNPTSVDITSTPLVDIVCYLTDTGGNEYDEYGRLGVRLSALFVILIVSSAATFFPVLAARVSWLRINIYVYLFARYFGAGVIVATAFIHLLDPAYGEIGPASCVGLTGHWADYSWCPGIVLTSLMIIFLMDFGAEQYVSRKFGFAHGPNVEALITDAPGTSEGALGAGPNQQRRSITHTQMHSGDQDERMHASIAVAQANKDLPRTEKNNLEQDSEKGSPTVSLAEAEERNFQQQISAFLILEFGVIFHSVIIGLNLGTTGSEFSTLYPVLVFHQSFEGLGIGARMSAIPFPKRFHWLPWFLCTAYGLTTPIAIGIGLGLRNTYAPNSFTANVVSGVLDAISAGILIYTGLVELLARDFLFNEDLTRSEKRLTFMMVSVLLGVMLMALLGKWA